LKVCPPCFADKVPLGTDVTKSGQDECEWPEHAKALYSGPEAMQQ
jgi:hypothetical protein